MAETVITCGSGGDYSDMKTAEAATAADPSDPIFFKSVEAIEQKGGTTSNFYINLSNANGVDIRFGGDAFKFNDPASNTLIVSGATGNGGTTFTNTSGNPILVRTSYVIIEDMEIISQGTGIDALSADADYLLVRRCLFANLSASYGFYARYSPIGCRVENTIFMGNFNAIFSRDTKMTAVNCSVGYTTSTGFRGYGSGRVMCYGCGAAANFGVTVYNRCRGDWNTCEDNETPPGANSVGNVGSGNLFEDGNGPNWDFRTKVGGRLVMPSAEEHMIDAAVPTDIGGNLREPEPYAVSNDFEATDLICNLQVASSSAFDVTNVSVGLWVKLESPPGTTPTPAFIAKWGTDRSWALYMDNVGGGVIRLYLVVDTDGGAGTDYIRAWTLITTEANSGDWFHILATCDGASRNVEFFIDGVLASTTDDSSGSGTTINNGTDPVIVGALESADTNDIDGQVSCLRIYDGYFGTTFPPGEMGWNPSVHGDLILEYLLEPNNRTNHFPDTSQTTAGLFPTSEFDMQWGDDGHSVDIWTAGAVEASPYAPVSGAKSLAVCGMF